MTLIQDPPAGTGKRRPRIERQRSADPDSGPLMQTQLPATPTEPALSPSLSWSLTSPDPAGISRPTLGVAAQPVSVRRTRDVIVVERPERALTVEPAGRLEVAQDVAQSAPDLQQVVRSTGLDESLARLAHAGPRMHDVLKLLVSEAAALLDSPARLALADGDDLVWALESGDAQVPLGTRVDVAGTACAQAWRTGLIQRVSGPPSAGTPSGRCCGSPGSLLAVPLLRGAGSAGGRHADPTPRVLAVLALTAARTGWFDDADLEIAADLAEVCGERIAELNWQDAQVAQVAPLPPAKRPPADDWFTPAAQRSATPPVDLVPTPPPTPPQTPRSSRPTRAPARPHPSTFDTPLPPAMPTPDSMGLWQWDAITGDVTWSSPVVRLLGLPAGTELDLATVREAVVATDRGRFDVAVKAIASGRGIAGALRLITPDGRPKHAYAWSEVRRDDDGTLRGVWGGVVDVTAFEHDAAALRSGLAGLKAAQELAGLATWQWRADADTLAWSDQMYRLVGVDPEDFTPTLESWYAFIHPDDLDRARRLDQQASTGPDGERVETFRLIGPGGEIRHLQSWSTSSRQPGAGLDAPAAVYGATIDVTRQVQDRISLERLSATDPVTGLGNRLAYERRIQDLLPATPASGPRRAVTLILLDLDRFAVVNDSLGHQVGDRLLIEVARRLVAVVPEGALTARMGGDEFVVIPPVGVSPVDLRRVAEAIVEALRAPYLLPGTGELLICPASVGISMSDGRRVTSHDLLREADIALHRAKESGRDRFVVFDEALKTRTQLRRRADAQLRAALEERRLVMDFQPVIDFVNGRIVGAEGVVRLHDVDEADRPVTADLLLEIAEQTGLVVELDSWAIEAAIRQVARWRDDVREDGETPWLAINLSARSIEDPRVVRRLVDAVKRGELPRDRIKIQLTEKSFIATQPQAQAALRQLIANGIGIGIDDFGTGYSALAHLRHFDLDFLKIDRSFVASVGEDQRGDAVVMAIIDLAHAHGMRVIAEGVESGRQARRLRELGCDLAQGFHFGRPGEPARIMRG